MSRPTEEELKTALAEAARLRESGEDEFFLGKTLLNHHYRLGLLEDVMEKAKLYMHAGEPAHEHAMLCRAIDRADAASRHLGEEPEPPLGIVDE